MTPRIGRLAALSVLAVVGCGHHYVYAPPPPPPGTPCPQIGEANPKTELPKLREMFLSVHKDLIVAGGIVYVIPCSNFQVAGASESSGFKSADEQSAVIARSEGSKVASADEGSRTGAASERSAAGSADEASKLRQANEDSQHAAANSIVSCVVVPGGYQLQSRVDTRTLAVFDGAAFFSVGPDGVVR